MTTVVVQRATQTLQLRSENGEAKRERERESDRHTDSALVFFRAHLLLPSAGFCSTYTNDCAYIFTDHSYVTLIIFSSRFRKASLSLVLFWRKTGDVDFLLSSKFH